MKMKEIQSLFCPFLCQFTISFLLTVSRWHFSSPSLFFYFSPFCSPNLPSIPTVIPTPPPCRSLPPPRFPVPLGCRSTRSPRRLMFPSPLLSHKTTNKPLNGMKMFHLFLIWFHFSDFPEVHWDEFKCVQRNKGVGPGGASFMRVGQWQRAVFTLASFVFPCLKLLLFPALSHTHTHTAAYYGSWFRFPVSVTSCRLNHNQTPAKPQIQRAAGEKAYITGLRNSGIAAVIGARKTCRKRHCTFSYTDIYNIFYLYFYLKHYLLICIFYFVIVQSPPFPLYS